MPLSEADSRTVLLHLEVIRNIIRAGQAVPGDIRDVAAGFEPPTPATAPAPRVLKADGSVEAFVEPDLDGGCAAEAAATASRDREAYINDMASGIYD